VGRKAGRPRRAANPSRPIHGHSRASLDLQRQFFAEEIEAVARLKTPALVAALAAVPRERFLPPGPWTTLADVDIVAGGFSGSPAKHVMTLDADPRRVYHNIGIAIDPARQLFNGQPATLAAWIDALGLSAGKRVLHIGAGLGYYTAVMAHAVGPTGRIVAYEVDDALASAARTNLSPHPWVDLRHGDASGPIDGASTSRQCGRHHPLDSWLDALAADGKLVCRSRARCRRWADDRQGPGVPRHETRGRRARRARVHVCRDLPALGVRDEQPSERLGKDDGRPAEVAGRHAAAPRRARPDRDVLVARRDVLSVSVRANCRV
jgi:protein-L-isoaspartate(D-aspartate) O-methyltransferase